MLALGVHTVRIRNISWGINSNYKCCV